jgi:8-oxo-dGTP pyrophosphatase MutT (NUDIX family)
LARSIEYETRKWIFETNGKRGADAAVMWIRIPTDLYKTLPWFQKNGFETHHADRTHVMVVRPRSSKAVIPLYGTHYVRVECLVIEIGTGRVLMVRERLGPDQSLKLVTGSVDLNEYVSAAAEREVKEETGIVAKADGFIGCGNRLATRFSRDEILIGLLLYAERGQEPKFDGTEIIEALWIEPERAIDICTVLAKEWLLAGGLVIQNKWTLQKGFLPDFRGLPHRMEVFMPYQA